MTIDTSGEWWVGTEANDTCAYLVAYQAQGYRIDVTRLCRCDCGSFSFRLEADGDEGAARRVCCGCGADHLICDSAEYWDEAEPESWACTECGCEICNLGVAFSLYDAMDGEPRDVRWISVGQRCTRCGVLGSFVDWKVGYGGSAPLIDAV